MDVVWDQKLFDMEEKEEGDLLVEIDMFNTNILVEEDQYCGLK